MQKSLFNEKPDIPNIEGSTHFQSVRNILKIVVNKFDLYCFCIYICITIIK